MSPPNIKICKTKAIIQNLNTLGHQVSSKSGMNCDTGSKKYFLPYVYPDFMQKRGHVLLPYVYPDFNQNIACYIQNGHQFSLIAKTGKEAIKTIKNDLPDSVLLDTQIQGEPDSLY